MSRMDFRVTDDGTVYVLDVNAMPNLDPQKSLMPEICRRNGVPISELIRRAIDSKIYMTDDFIERPDRARLTLLNV